MEEWDVSDECKRYFRQRLSWQQIIIVNGVTEIPASTFFGCKNIEKVIFADSVIRIEERAFFSCAGLFFIKFPTNLEYIGADSFKGCNLSSAFIPPTCQEICRDAFADNWNLSMKRQNDAGITPSQYLKENPYSALTEKEIIREYLMKAMGEVE